MSTTTTEVVGGQKVRRTKRRVEPIYYLFLLPSLILFTLAITIPGIIGIFFSFTDSIATRANEISQLIDGLCCVQAITIRFKAKNVFDIALINHVERV